MSTHFDDADVRGAWRSRTHCKALHIRQGKHQLRDKHESPSGSLLQSGLREIAFCSGPQIPLGDIWESNGLFLEYYPIPAILLQSVLIKRSMSIL